MPVMKRAVAMVMGEPYRLLFPMGMLAGIWGVMMWPIFYGGHLAFYPNEAHARMMTAGFMGAFVAGFLGTAFPRLTGGRTWTVLEMILIPGCWLAMVAAWSRGMVRAGDGLFVAMVLSLLTGMAARGLRGRRDIPPPGFVLVFAGLSGAALAALWLASGRFVSVELWRFARLWYFQGFLLLPMMGIGPFLLPRFFGMPSGHSFDTATSPPPGWWTRCLLSSAAGLCVIASFALEAWGWPMAGQLSRAVVVLVWFAVETPVFRKVMQRTTPGTAVRWSIVSMVAGLVCAAVWPLARIGSLHLFFVSGLGLVTMAVGTRVILGHAGHHDLLGGKIVWLRWVIGLAILAAATRMTSDFIPAVRISHHNYAAWSWAAAALVWLLALGKHLFADESEPKPRKACPRKKRRAGC